MITFRFGCQTVRISFYQIRIKGSSKFYIQFELLIMDQKEVLKAILNVKKYTKNLKQTATNLQQQTAAFFSNNNAKTDNNIPLTYSSTIGFYKSKEIIQTPSTGLIPKERSNDDIVSHRKVKGMSKIQKSSEMFTTDEKLFHSKQKHILSETEKSNKTDNHENSKNIHKITAKNLANILNSSLQNKESMKKHGNNGHSHTYTHLNNADICSNSNFPSSKSKIMVNAMGKKHLHSRSPSSRNREISQLNVQSISSFNNEIKMDSQIDQNCQRESDDRNGKEKLLTKIKNLEMTISNYQKVLLKVKEKYFQMEKQIIEKVSNDQFIDLLKAEIQVITRKNEKLLSIIHSQKQKIDSFQKRFVESLQKIQQKYIEEIKNAKQTNEQNTFLRKLLICTQIQNNFLQNGINPNPILQIDTNKSLIQVKNLEQMKLKYKMNQ